MPSVSQNTLDEDLTIKIMQEKKKEKKRKECPKSGKKPVLSSKEQLEATIFKQTQIPNSS